jgi:hypothetical protein
MSGTTATPDPKPEFSLATAKPEIGTELDESEVAHKDMAVRLVAPDDGRDNVEMGVIR